MKPALGHADYARFLDALRKSGVIPSAWEHRFIANTMRLTRFSEGQCRVIERMITKYSGLFRW